MQAVYANQLRLHDHLLELAVQQPDFGVRVISAGALRRCPLLQQALCILQGRRVAVLARELRQAGLRLHELLLLVLKFGSQLCQHTQASRFSKKLLKNAVRQNVQSASHSMTRHKAHFVLDDVGVFEVSLKSR